MNFFIHGTKGSLGKHTNSGRFYEKKSQFMVEIFNIQNDPNTLSLNFNVYGTNEKGKGFIMGVDFSGLH